MASEDAYNTISGTPQLPDEPQNVPMRIVLLSTPRSGNNWLRHLLAKLYRIPSLAVHNPADVDWATLPLRCVLGIHWHPVPPFLSLLERHGFRALVLARHPLDVLVSILHFALHAPTVRWLEGEGGDERPLYGAMPRSAPFLEYAAGARAAALLCVSREWWTVPGCLRVRYEELVADPHRTLERVADGLGVAPQVPPDTALAETTIPKLRALTSCPPHFWQGRPGLWKRLLPAAEACAIAKAQSASFSGMGYVCDPDPDLQPGSADANWVELVGANLAEELQNLASLRKQLETSQDRAQASQTELAASQEALTDLRARFAATQQALQDLMNRSEQERALQDQVTDLEPAALEDAWRLHHFARRHPRTARLFAWFLRRQSGSFTSAPPRNWPTGPHDARS